MICHVLKIAFLFCLVVSASSYLPLFWYTLSMVGSLIFGEQKGSSLRSVFELLVMWSDLLWGQVACVGGVLQSNILCVGHSERWL